MITFLLAIPLVLLSMLSTGGLRNHPPAAVADQYFLLFYPLPVVDIPVLENDTDPDGDALHVTGLLATEGGTAQVLDNGAVRVYLDWSSDNSGPDGLVAYGTYVVSDGTASSSAVWSVWYWPFMLPATAEVN